MNKLLSLAFIFAALSGFAQSTTTTTTTTTANNRWRLGLKVAPGVSYFKSNRNTMTPNGVGFALGGGLQIEYAMTKTVSFCTGVEIMRHSAGIAFTDTTYLLYNSALKQIESQRYAVQSVDIPLTLKLKTNEIGYITYWAQFGVLPSVTFKASSSSNNFSDGTSTTETLDLYNDVAVLRASVIGGLGIEYSFAGSTALLVGVHYVDGFTPTTSWRMDSESLTTDPAAELNTDGKTIKSKDALAQNLSSKYFTLTVGLLF